MIFSFFKNCLSTFYHSIKLGEDHLGDAGDILPELGEFLNREFEQLIGVASKDNHGVARQILISCQSDNALLEFRHFEAKAVFFQVHIFTDGAVDPFV